ncbi:zinc finger protein ZXDC isoform X6 [Mustela putorius furo]|uniref:Zinc finger protein ZXDC isoform X6 n=1 Tax=Mustela putorius furo TaxID=9669 RepID=A0A8U0UK67_MUSPF|nr:zinc finger protein ZXDC isoform X6 [Mustela putorius furo]
MDLPKLLAAPTARGAQHGGGVGPGRLRRGPGPPPSPGPARRRLLLLRGSEDGGPGPLRGEAPAASAGPGPSPPPPEDGGDSFVVLLEVARGGAAEDPGRREVGSGAGASPITHSEPGPSCAATAPGSGAALAGTVTINSQDLLVRFDHGVFTLAAAPPQPGQPPRGPPAPPGEEVTSPAEGRRGPQGPGPSAPGYRCPEPQCTLSFAKKHQLKVHLLTHGGSQGRRPFKCPLDGCGWAFTTSYKLKRHLQSHDKLRPFGCPVGGCGKKFTTVYNLKAHMKGHEQENLFKCEVCSERFPTHAKLSSHQRSHFEPERPYKCDFPGCCARFSARSSLYIHSKKHLQDVGAPKSRCPVSSCNRLFTSKHSMKAHVVRQHSRRPDLFPQLGAPSSLTHSSELSSPGQSELNNLDLAALFSDAPGDGGSAAGASDEALNSGILTIDVTSVSASLGGNLPANNSSLGPMDPLVLVAHSDIPPSLDSPLVLGTAATVLQQGSFGMDDIQTVNAGALGCLVALPVKNLSPDPQALTSGGHLTDTISTLTSPSPPPGDTSGPELLAPIKVEPASPPSPNTVRQQERSRGAPRSAFCSPAEKHSPQKDTGLSAGTGSFYLLCDVGLPRFSEHRWCVVNGLQESGGSARTDSRAIQLAKKKKQKGTGSNAGNIQGSTSTDMCQLLPSAELCITKYRSCLPGKRHTWCIFLPCQLSELHRVGDLLCACSSWRCRSLRVRSEENERWQSQSYSLAHEPAWLVVWEPCGAQWRSASTGSSSRSAVRSAPATAGRALRRSSLIVGSQPAAFCPPPAVCCRFARLCPPGLDALQLFGSVSKTVRKLLAL